VWEGQSTTLANLQVIREVLNEFRERIELHVVTDPMIHRWFGRFYAHSAQDALRGIQCPVRFHLWERASFSIHITSADVALIPIDTSNAMARGKPENKLILLWQLGMPVLVSATPAYQRAMSAAGVDMVCAHASDWREQLERLIRTSSSELEQIGRNCKAFAERVYSRDEFLKRFDAVLEAAGFTT
jgi:hypothetical protein